MREVNCLFFYLTFFDSVCGFKCVVLPGLLKRIWNKLRLCWSFYCLVLYFLSRHYEIRMRERSWWVITEVPTELRIFHLTRRLLWCSFQIPFICINSVNPGRVSTGRLLNFLDSLNCRSMTRRKVLRTIVLYVDSSPSLGKKRFFRDRRTGFPTKED